MAESNGTEMGKTYPSGTIAKVVCIQDLVHSLDAY